MSLRARLALLYTFLVGGILLVFGMAVYIAVSLTLIGQVNSSLIITADLIRVQAGVTDVGELDKVGIPELGLPTDVFVQLWQRNRILLETSPNLPHNPKASLDHGGLRSSTPIFRDVTFNNEHFRVLTVPLTFRGSNRVIGYMQVGTAMSLLDSTQRTLLVILFAASVMAMAVAALAGWVSTRRALRPLETVTETALQITSADDLSHRIPYDGPPNDEIGQLIRAFNQTLSRLENLFESQRRFLADVGHELRTPLTVIKGNIYLMRRMDCTDEESMVSIENEVERLTRLVGDLLLLAQAESGRLPLDWKTVELDTLLLDSMQQMQVLAGNKLILRLGEIDQALVCGDQDRLKQVLVNLIGNAVKYTPVSGEVIVGLSKEDNMAKISVSDNGPGIPAEDLPFIFDRFYRGEKSRTRSKDGKGFGLGLSIAYWIIQNHGGTIEVSSQEAVGTTFDIWLPLKDGDCKEMPA